MAETFLALTANRRFWREEGRLVLLGEWCLRGAQEGEGKAAAYEMMPSPWEDRGRYFAAAAHADHVYEDLLGKLAAYLNPIHGVDFDLRYWRLLIGPWLMYYVSAFYDHYCHIQAALERYGSFETRALEVEADVSSTGYRDFFGLLTEDTFNLLMYSEILDFLGVPCERRPLSSGERECLRPALILKREKYFRMDPDGIARFLSYHLLSAWYRLLAGRETVTLYRPPLSPGEFWRLLWKSGLRIALVDLLPTRLLSARAPQLNDQRRGLAGLAGTGEFESFIAGGLVRHFPALYLEGYAEARGKARQALGRVPQDLLSAFGWSGSEHFKFLAAECASQGGTLRVVQHGGGYGISQLAPHEVHERKIADVFYTWGWAEGSGPGVKDLPSPKLSAAAAGRASRARRFSRQKQIVLVTNNHTPYFLRFDTMGEKNAEFTRWRVRFIAALSPECRARLIVRLHPHDYGRSVRRGLGDRFKDVRFDNGIPLRRRFDRVRLIVVDHNSTSLNEAFASNCPTVVFWNPHYWECREEAARPYLEALEEAGILFYSPEEAARQVSEIYGQVDLWWREENVVRARRQFASRFAQADEAWAEAWVAELTKPVLRPAGEPREAFKKDPGVLCR